MANYGIKVAKSGYDYDDGDKRLIYNSNYPLLKIVDSGTDTLTLSSGNGSKTLKTHSLGYEPFFFVWIEYVDVSSGNLVNKLRMCSFQDYAGLGVSTRYVAYVTTTTLELEVFSASSTIGSAGNETLDIVWVLFYDPLS